MLNSTQWKIHVRAWLVVFFATTGFLTTAQELTSLATTAQPPRNDGSLSQIQGTVSFKAESISLQEILSGLEKQSEYVFIYTDDEIPTTRKFSLNVTKQPMEDFLTRLFQTLDIRYKLFGRQIVLSTESVTTKYKDEVAGATAANKDEMNESVIVLPSYEKTYSAPITFSVSGKVVDENNTVLPGVSVLEKGTTNGTTTDATGNYKIELTSENSTLIFSFIGYLSEEMAVNNQSTINIRMMPDVKTLSEVVIVGYGQQKKGDVTGAVATVAPEAVKNMPVPSLGEALQSRVAGVVVTQGSGEPGRTADIQIRGSGNMSGIAPLYIVDGVQISSPDGQFNFQDIESISILKDASAAAIYGARAAGGVIIVTTKKGKSGKPKVSFNATSGITSLYNMPKLLNRDQYIEVKKMYNPGNTRYDLTPDQLAKYPDTDWMNVLYGKGLRQNYNLSLSGGNESSTYYMSMNYGSEKGTRIGTGFEKFGLRLNSDHKVSKFLKIGQTLYTWRTNTDPQAATDGTQIPFRTSPGMPIYDDTNPGAYSLVKWGYLNPSSPFEGYNYYASEYIEKQKVYSEAVEGTLYTSVTPVKNLEWRTTGGMVVRKDFNSDTGLPFYQGTQSKREFASFTESRAATYKFTFNTFMQYSLEVGKHKFTPMVGLETIQGSWDNISASFDHYTLTPYPTTINQGIDDTDPSNYHVKTGASSRGPSERFYSLFARATYSYNDKYMATFNVRRDGSTKFGPVHRFGVFPSFSAAWNIHNENFMKDVRIFSSLRLRAGSGTIGNTPSDASLYQKNYETPTLYSFNDNIPVNGINLEAKLPNPSIQWEAIQTNSVAAEMGFLDERFTAIVEYYVRNTKKMLYPTKIPTSFGYGDHVIENIGQVKNSGLEITLNYRDKIGQVNYSIGANSSFNSNKIVKLDGIDNSLRSDGYRSDVGGPVGRFYGLQAVGVYHDNQINATNPTTAGGVAPQAGDLIFVDRNHDGKIMVSDDPTLDDRTFIGNPFPKVNYGVNGSVNYKNFDMTFLFSGAAKMDVWNQMRYRKQAMEGDFTTSVAVFNNSGFGDNGVTNQPSHIHYGPGQNEVQHDPYGNYTQFSSYFVEKGGYLKLRNIQIGYKIPTSLLSKVSISSARFYLMGQNLFMITKYSGIDPETTANYLAGGQADQLWRYPPTRVYSIGLDINF